jgi:hypothetical protein
MTAPVTNLPWHTKIVLALLAFLPLFFAVSALGTKFGVWGWQTGLLTLTFFGGMILLAVTSLNFSYIKLTVSISIYNTIGNISLTHF